MGPHHGRTARLARGCSRSCRCRQSQRGPSCGWGKSCRNSFGTVAELFCALLRDELVDPFEVVLGGRGAVLLERPGVTVDRSRCRLAVGGEALGELRPAALQKCEARGRLEIAT